jgi:ABC-2 type transport system permease protein
VTSPHRVSASSPAGNIYDLGYRHYDGVRRGRGYATWSLYVESLRSIWGFGRPTTAKAAPFILLGLYSFAAFMQLAFSSFIAQAGANAGELFAYDNYFLSFWIMIVLFCIAQAPEQVCRDQRNNVLPLYFTRSLRRFDYAIAKLAALTSALFIVLMIPMIALFIGDVLMKPDAIRALGDELPKAWPSIPANLLVAAGMAALSLALSSFSPRRAYSAIGLGAYFLVVEAVAAIVYEVGRQGGWTWSDKCILLGPVTTLMGATAWFFDKALDPRQGFPPTLGADAYLLASLGSVVVFTAVLLFRYRRLAA